MDLQEAWKQALKRTEIVRPRVQPLHTTQATHLPYIFLAESSVNDGDTVVRRGEVVVEKPALILPFNTPQFEGFHFEEEMKVSETSLTNFFILRGVSFPSMKVNNVTSSIDVQEGALSAAIRLFQSQLHQAENVHTGLVVGEEHNWQFSVLIFVCTQVMRSAEGDLKKLLDDFRTHGS